MEGDKKKTEPVLGPGEFIVGQNLYRCGRMPARLQYHLHRKIFPIVVKLDQLAATAVKDKPPTMLDVAAAIAPDLQRLSMEDANFVLDTCLSVTSRQQSHEGVTSWQPVRRGTVDMFDDMTSADFVQIQINAIRENLGNFTVGSLLK